MDATSRTDTATVATIHMEKALRVPLTSPAPILSAQMTWAPVEKTPLKTEVKLTIGVTRL